MRIVRTTLAAVLMLGSTAFAQVAQPSAPPAQTPPPTQSVPPEQAVPPAQPPAPGATAVVPPPVVPTPPAVARSFTAPTGMIFNAVRPERVVDFELVVGYLQAALAKATSPQVSAQAKGWRMFKATEPGPNGTVLYVFVMDPAVAGVDYALGPILSDAYPDQIEQIWKLYQGALAGAGSLLNLTPVEPPPLPATGPPMPGATPPPARPAPPAVTTPEVSSPAPTPPAEPPPASAAP